MKENILRNCEKFKSGTQSMLDTSVDCCFCDNQECWAEKLGLQIDNKKRQ